MGNCSFRMKDLQADFGPGACSLPAFWATEVALGFAMLVRIG